MEESLHLNLLNPDQAMNFMIGWQRLTKCEQEIILFLLDQSQHSFVGTNMDLTKSLQRPESYNSAVCVSINNMDNIGIIKLSVEHWYVRTITLTTDWINRLILLGLIEEDNDNSKKIQKHAG